MSIQLAQGLADKYHAGQKYGEHPYMYHIHSVVTSIYSTVNSETDCELAVIVGYLHDILEDTQCPREVILHLFGTQVLEALVAITKVMGERYEDYIERVRSNELAKFVKIHDTLCNLNESVRDGDTWRITKYAKQLHLLTR